MERFTIKNLTLTYPNRPTPALADVTISVEAGQFVVVCGKSGCGKTTLLRLLKSALAPHGTITGEIFYDGKPLCETDPLIEASQIGFVQQHPEHQIVTDKVWHELAFGLESLGLSQSEIRIRTAETASFFGMEELFHKKVSELSGGQKQLLNLASVMAMQPRVLLLDEPTSRLDPIAASEFLGTLAKINRELGVTVILTEHRLEEVFTLADRAVVLEGGKVVADAPPAEAGLILHRAKNDMERALPAAMRIGFGINADDPTPPITVREGRNRLAAFAEKHPIDPSRIPHPAYELIAPIVAELRDVWFRYEKSAPDVLRGMSLSVKKGELYAITGGNGAGKTTAMQLIAGLLTPYRGEVLLDGKKLKDIENPYQRLLGVLPQNPESLFLKKTLALDLYEALDEMKLTQAEKEKELNRVADLCDLRELLELHPYDLSGGEQQRAALAKVLLRCPTILLLDEPTKGMDAHFKEKFARILQRLKNEGTTAIMVSHDIEFCAAHADRCSLVFDGGVVSLDTPRRFFAGKSYYTTSANRIGREILPAAVLPEDIILACGGELPQLSQDDDRFDDSGHFQESDYSTNQSPQIKPPQPTALIRKEETSREKSWRLLRGVLSLALFATLLLFGKAADGWRAIAVQGGTVAAFLAAFFSIFPGKQSASFSVARTAGNYSPKRIAAVIGILLVAVPLTVLAGTLVFGDRKYYFIGLLVLAEMLLPFFLLFEGRKPKARELVVIAVLCAVAVAGRMAFFMMPQFKPMVALVILAGVCFGAETGFFVGAMSGFVSNLFFGQGPWTPWQMFAFGIIGFFAGILFPRLFTASKLRLCVFGGIAAALYGGIMNPASVLLAQNAPTPAMFAAAFALGFPFDLIHAASTIFFLWIAAGPFIEKLERIKVKYGLLEQ